MSMTCDGCTHSKALRSARIITLYISKKIYALITTLLATYTLRKLICLGPQIQRYFLTFRPWAVQVFALYYSTIVICKSRVGLLSSMTLIPILTSFLKLFLEYWAILPFVQAWHLCWTTHLYSEETFPIERTFYRRERKALLTLSRSGCLLTWKLINAVETIKNSSFFIWPPVILENTPKRVRRRSGQFLTVIQFRTSIYVFVFF